MDFDKIIKSGENVGVFSTYPCVKIGDYVYNFRPFDGLDQQFICDLAKRYNSIHFPRMQFVGRYKDATVWKSPYYEPLPDELKCLVMDVPVHRYIARLPSASLKRAVEIIYKEFLNKKKDKRFQVTLDICKRNIRMDGNTPIFLDPVCILLRCN